MITIFSLIFFIFLKLNSIASSEAYKNYAGFDLKKRTLAKIDRVLKTQMMKN